MPESLVGVEGVALDQAVGVESQDAALGDVHANGFEGQTAEAEGRAAGEVHKLGGAAGRDERRCRVACAGKGVVAGDRVVDGVQAGRPGHAGFVVGFLGDPADHVVQVCQHLVGGEVDVGEGLYGGAEPSHGGGGVDAVSDHVPDDQGDAGSGERDDVEPVAAHACCRVGGQVAVGGIDCVLFGQVVGEQAALEG